MNAREILLAVRQDVENGNLTMRRLGDCGDEKGCMIGLVHKHSSMDERVSTVLGSDLIPGRVYPGAAQEDDGDARVPWKRQGLKALSALAGVLPRDRDGDDSVVGRIVGANDYEVRGDKQCAVAWIDKALARLSA